MYIPARFNREAFSKRDLAWALRLHQAVSFRPVRHLLITVSMLGDGIVWLLLAIWVGWRGGERGIYCLLSMLLLGGMNLLLYWLLKRRTSRPRPYMECPDIHLCTPALDRYSFPSGHMLHATAFSLLVPHFFPEMAGPLWTFTGLVALSRVVLGLHYPSDVLAAAGIGLATGGMVLNIL